MNLLIHHLKSKIPPNYQPPSQPTIPRAVRPTRPDSILLPTSTYTAWPYQTSSLPPLSLSHPLPRCTIQSAPYSLPLILNGIDRPWLHQDRDKCHVCFHLLLRTSGESVMSPSSFTLRTCTCSLLASKPGRCFRASDPTKQDFKVSSANRNQASTKIN
jgi:hypothetical protein